MKSKHKILCTCPPMILQIHQFEERFKQLNWDVVCPKFNQTLTEEELIDMLGDYDGWIIGDDPANANVFSAGRKRKLRAAVKWGAGVDNVDFEAANELNIPISNTPGTFAEEVSDVAIGYLIGLARGLFAIDRGVRSNNWPKPVGMTLKGKAVGIVGLGHVGRCLARKLDVIGLTVVGYDPFVESIDGVKVVLKKWPDGIENLDFLVLCCALTNENKHMINNEVLDRIKSGAYLVNVGRGSLILEKALIPALQSAKISGAALEVMEMEPLPSDSELRSFDNVVFGSHNSSNTLEAVIHTSGIAIDILNSYLTE